VFAYPSFRPHETNFRAILYWGDLLKSIENNSSFARIGQNETGTYFVQFYHECLSYRGYQCLCACYGYLIATDFLVTKLPTFLGHCSYSNAPEVFRCMEISFLVLSSFLNHECQLYVHAEVQTSHLNRF